VRFAIEIKKTNTMKKIIYYTIISIIGLLSNYNVYSQTNCSANFVDSAHFSNGCTVDFYHFNNNPSHTSFLSYNFGDGTFGSNTTSPNNVSVTTHTYTSSGWHNVCLTMWDSSFCQNSYCDSIYVNCGGSSNCSAHFVDTIHNGCSVTFNYSTPWPTYLGYYFHWTFGDGTSLSGNPNSNPNIPYPTHTYSSSGWYNVCLSIVDSANQCQAYYCDSIYVNCGSSNCSVNWTHTTQNCNTTFISTVTPSNNGWNYSWNFGDGNSSSQANPSHTYSSNGIYNVCLTAWNNISGCADTVCYSVNITNCSNSNCSAVFTDTIYNGCSVTFYHYTSYPAYLNYYYTWTFGDGTSMSGTVATNGQIISPTHTYTSSGWYNVCLSIIDSANQCQAYYCDSIYVNCGTSSCNVQWTHSVQNCIASFYSSVTPSGSGWYYYWNFGDGGTSNQANPSHTYSSNGTYNVCLTAWNNLTQCSDTLCFPIQITNCGSSSNCQIMFTSFDSACYTYFIPTVTPFNPNYNYIWNFGDGNSSNQQYPVHQYNAPGLYYACVTIWDSSSTCQATYCDTVIVNCTPNSINEMDKLKDFKLYPNPANDRINLNFSLIQSEKVSITITDISGRVVDIILESQYLSSGNRTIEYNLNKLNSGIYFANTIIGSEISVHKFIKH
jgi:PKD repeat protein